LFSAPRLAPPGTHFCYGNAGTWLAAAIVEHVFKMPFLHALQTRLFQPLGITAYVGSRRLTHALNSQDRVCPANGIDLRLEARDLMKIAACHLSSEPAEIGGQDKGWTVGLREGGVSLRGWHPKIRRACLGFHDLGDDWYGQNSRLDGESALFRFSPSRNIATAVIADREGAAYIVFASLFGGSHCELDSISPPRLLDADSWANIPVAGFTGSFENAALRIQIRQMADRSIAARVFSRIDISQAGPVVKRQLLPAESNLFFPSPPERFVIPFVQFLDPDSDGEFRYLHTGRRLFARSD